VAISRRRRNEKNKIRQLSEAIPLSIASCPGWQVLFLKPSQNRKGLATRRNSKLKVVKALQKKYEEVFILDDNM